MEKSREKKCTICGNRFVKPPRITWEEWKKRKSCNRQCAGVLRELTGIGKGRIPWNKGKKSPQNTGSKHYKWKGDKVKYRSLHQFIESKLGIPSTCEHCKKTELHNTTKHRPVDWANKSGEYKRDLDDWMRLCRKCHRRYDLNQ